MSRPAGPAIALAVYFPAVCLGHLAFSIWLVSPRQTPFGEFAFKQLVPYLSVAASLALLGWLVWAARRARTPGRMLIGWALWLAAVALVDRDLTYSINEVAHYPEYAIVAWLLAATLDPFRMARPVGRVLFWTTLLGAVDECQQYIWIAPSYGDYFDFNDVLVNLLGGVLGLLLYYRFEPLPMRPARLRPSIPEMLAAALLTAALAGLAFSGRLELTPPREVPPGGLLRGDDGVTRLYLERKAGSYDRDHPGDRHPSYHVLGPATGLAWVVIGGVLFTVAIGGTGRRARIVPVTTGAPGSIDLPDNVGSACRARSSNRPRPDTIIKAPLEGGDR